MESIWDLGEVGKAGVIERVPAGQRFDVYGLEAGDVDVKGRIWNFHAGRSIRALEGHSGLIAIFS